MTEDELQQAITTIEGAGWQVLRTESTHAGLLLTVIHPLAPGVQRTVAALSDVDTVADWLHPTGAEDVMAALRGH